jgi:hypothetical protein
VYIGGGFTRINGVRREDGIAAVNARTGRPTAWAPYKGAVYDYLDKGSALVVSHGQVLVGGLDDFAAVSVLTGRGAPWTKRVHGNVPTIAVLVDTAYLGGDGYDEGFDGVAGKRANNLASVVLPGGMFTNWRPNIAPCVFVESIAPSADEVLVAGRFSYSASECS